jgi:hypothetical protein
VSIRSGDIGFNRDVTSGSINSSGSRAFQIHHDGSTNTTADYLAYQVYDSAGVAVTSSALVIKGDGNIGIGTTVPSEKFHVIGNAIISGNSTTTNATTTALFSTTASSTNLFTSNLGVASTTPTTKLSVGQGAISVAEYQPATSTSMTVDWTQGNQQVVRIGTSATAIAFSNFIAGQKLALILCNPGSTGGAVTFTGVLWAGGTAPTTTTTANKCDIITFLATNATSTLKIFGGYNQAY